MNSIPPSTARAGDPELGVPQDPAAETTDPMGSGVAGPEVHLNLVDQKLAVSLAVDTHAQIELTEFALKGVASDALRRYLTIRLESQHAFAARLDALTGGRTREAIVRALRKSRMIRPRTSHKARSCDYCRCAMPARWWLASDWKFCRSTPKPCRTELAAKSSEEFDRHYLRYELANQMQMLAALRVFETQASADFALVIREAWTTAKEQLDHARQLLAATGIGALGGLGGQTGVRRDDPPAARACTAP